MSSLLYILFILYFWSIVTFVYILPWLCQDLGFSLYYKASKHSKEKLEAINTERTLNAFRYFARLEAKTQSIISLNGPRYPQENHLKFAFVIVSVKRRSNPHYLIQVVARLLEQTRGENDPKWKAKVIVFNAETNPSDNSDAKFLGNYVTVVSHQTLYKGINKSMVDNVYEKEKLDYISSLEIGVYLNAEYTVIIEDDALPDRNFLQRIKFLIKWKIPWFRTKPNWAFLKFYYPEKWQGYGNPEIPEMVLIFLVGGIIPTAIYVYVFRFGQWFKRNKYRQQTTMLIVLFISCGLYCTAVAYTVGRVHIIELGKLSPIFYRMSQAPGCCTPCVLYPKLHLKQIIEFLQSKQCSKNYPLDFALDDFVSVRKLVKYVVSPNLVSHVGFHSSLDGANKDLKEFSLLFDP